MYCYSACMPQGIYFITDTNKARYHVFLFPVPTSINTHFVRCLRDTHAVDRIFDISNSTQDVYDEFGQPIVLSAMDGFNGEHLRLP